MKKYYFVLLACMATHISHAQLYVGSGANVSTTGHAIIALQHANLINNGTYEQGAGGITVFNGSGNDSIKGTSFSTTFDSLEIAKTSGGNLIMQQFIYVNNILKFTTGLLDLYGKTVYLKSTASLAGETETSHATDTVLGGSISIQQSLNAPAAVNPGNLGAIITSSKNLGSTTVTRYHTGQITNGASTQPTIYRQFEITPFPASNNTGLDGTLRFQYLDAELHGMNESSLMFFKSTTYPYNSFTDEGFDNRNVAANYAEKQHINDFSLWVLTDQSPLPLKLLSFFGKCEQAGAALRWQTADEVQVSHIDVQQSTDGVRWNAIGSVPYQNYVHDYSFTSSTNGSYYRLSIVDLDGHTEYSGIINVRCDIYQDELTLFPNPANTIANLQIAAQQASQLQLNIYAANGGLVATMYRQLQEGSQLIPLNISSFAAGAYFVQAYWGNGKYSKTVKLVKQ